ncbi:MAG: PIN domain-containing protein [Thermoplasmata archaeon]|nr:PIN domain-containing protein [Thermoplasmata archaeon]
MKGLDTPVLLEILAGGPSATKLLRGLAGEELCTTEANFFELETIARSDRGAALERRLAALERLRRGMTVLPLDERAGRAAAIRSKGDPQGLPTDLWLVWGALEANGCTEWITSPSALVPKGPGKVRTRRIKT